MLTHDTQLSDTLSKTGLKCAFSNTYRVRECVYSFVKSYLVSGFISSFTMGKDMEITTENLPARRVSAQKNSQKITYPRAGGSKWSLIRQIIEVCFEQLQ